MAATAGVTAFGTLLRWDNADVLELTSISGPTETMDPLDVTSHDSDNQFREFVAGLHDGGEITFEGNCIVGDSTGQVAMHTDFQATDVKAWEIRFPTYNGGTPKIGGNGFITAFTWNFPFDGPVTISGTIKITGKPSYTPV